MKLYVIRDMVLGESGPIFEQKNDAVARRSYNKLRQSQDFTESDNRLYCIGEYDHIEDQGVFYKTPVEILFEEVELNESGL